MSAFRFGTTANTLKPGPRLVIDRAADGMTSGSMEFTCRKGDIDSPAIQTKLAKGQLISVLYPEVPVGFNFMRVDSWTSRDEPGAYTVVSVEFKGADVTGDEYTYEGSVVYTRNNSLRDEPILNNAKFKEAIPTDAKRELYRGGIAGTYYLSGSATIKSTATDAEVGYLDNETEQFWWSYIVTEGNHTYLRATSEWTKTATGKGALRASDFADFGKIDTPPGSPAAPAGDTWLYSGATESIAVSGDGANSYSKTWISGEWPTEVFGP